LRIEGFVASIATALALAVSPSAWQAGPLFEAATIKENRSDAAATMLGFEAGGRFRATNEPVWRLIGEAFADPIPLPRDRILRGPTWMYTDRFDVAAVAQGDPDPAARRAMLRALLVDRFRLSVRVEQRDLPVFELRLTRDDGTTGPQLRRSEVDCAAAGRSGGAAPPAPSGQAPPCVMSFGFGRLSAVGMTLDQLASMGLSRVAGRPVVNRTGLEGVYDWTVIWTPDNLPPRAPGTPADQPILVNGLAVDPDGPTLPTALREQLGLRLVAGRGPVPVVVVERVERPTPD
jgi:uncharacterized protein (TIGR03435 family)